MLIATQLSGFGGAVVDTTDLVTNGTFASDTVWTKGGGWTISGGTANHTASAGNLSQSITFVVGATYRVTWTISGYSAGIFLARLSGGTNVSGSNRTSNGTYSDDLVAVSGNNTLNIVGNSDAVGSVDNVSCKRVA
jgi:hypothetical protein